MTIDVSIGITDSLAHESSRAGAAAITALDYELLSGMELPRTPVSLSMNKSELSLRVPLTSGEAITFSLPDTVDPTLNYILATQWRRGDGSVCPVQAAGRIISQTLAQGSGTFDRAMDASGPVTGLILPPGSYVITISLTNVTYPVGASQSGRCQIEVLDANDAVIRTVHTRAISPPEVSLVNDSSTFSLSTRGASLRFRSVGIPSTRLQSFDFTWSLRELA